MTPRRIRQIRARVRRPVLTVQVTGDALPLTADTAAAIGRRLRSLAAGHSVVVHDDRVRIGGAS